MNSSHRRSLRSLPAVRAVRPELHWIHDGLRYRVTVWPDVQFQQERSPGRWRCVEMTETALASAALGVSAAQWRAYLEFMPAAEREFLQRFQFTRMTALHVIVRCPALFADLAETPALTAFLAAHLTLRGGAQAGWSEISALFERDGIHGVLQWLGLPASPQTLGILRNIADVDVPRRLLEPLRAALWEPETIWALAHTPALTDERLAAACHALAA